MSASLCFIDCETTGLDPLVHELFEVFATRRDESGEASLRLWLPVDLNKASNDALAVNKYRERVRSEHPNDPCEAARQLARITTGCHLVGLSPAFDARFVGDFMRRHGQLPSWHYHLVDLESMIAGRLGLEPPWRSEDLSRAIGIEPPDATGRHTAEGDVLWSIELYEALVGVRP